MKPRNFIYIALGGLALGALLGVGLKLARQDGAITPLTVSHPVVDEEQLSTVPDFNYADLSGKQRFSNEWKAKVLVLNFWASWCPPCREETPLFVELQEQYQSNNVKFVGIAVDDVEPVQEFADTYGVNYPILMGDIKAITLSRKLGNRFEGLPFTVVAAPGGKVLLTHAGGMTREQLEPVLRQAIDASRRTLDAPARI